jgi:hypothetical protein
VAEAHSAEAPLGLESSAVLPFAIAIGVTVSQPQNGCMMLGVTPSPLQKPAGGLRRRQASSPYPRLAFCASVARPATADMPSTIEKAREDAYPAGRPPP